MNVRLARYTSLMRTIATFPCAVAAAVLAVALLLPLRVAADTPALPAEAAGRFLLLLDSGATAAAWQELTPLARVIKSEERWTRMHAALRSANGPAESRTLRGVTLQERYPMLPDGHYAIVQYDTSFRHKRASVETVVLAETGDGDWHIQDYVLN